MTREQLDLIPSPTLFNTHRLLEWLAARGWRMTLLEVDAERRRRKAVR